MTRLRTAMDQIVFARTYSLRLIDQIDSADWFRQPAEGVTHVAWQVGHLAMAQYRLALERIRGPLPEDVELISPEFLECFGKQSVPEVDPAHYPAPAAIRAVFERVHDQVLRELPEIPEAELDQPPVKPHSLFNRKIDSLFWCSQHEMLHAGQIGLLRRLQGSAPLW